MAFPKDAQIRTIVIVGWGTAGVLTTYYLYKNFPHIQLEWIFPEENETIWVWEATIPYVHEFLNKLGLDYATIIKECNGSIKLGLKFENFYTKQDVFYHSFWSSFESSAYTEQLMKYDRIDEQVFQNSFNFALHFDVRELFSFVYEKVKWDERVTIIREKGLPLESWWQISGIQLESGEVSKGDFYIDCTGFWKRLIGTLLKDNFLNCESTILNNKALVYRTQYTDEKLQVPYTTCYGTDFGWIWNIPLGDKISFGYIHNDKYDVREDFISYLKMRLWWEIDVSKIQEVPFLTGRNNLHFYENVFTIGLSSAFIEPIESTWLYFIVRNIELFGDFLNGKVTWDEINEALNTNYDGVLNFVLAHYKYSLRSNEYWSWYKDKQCIDFQKNDLFTVYSRYKILKWFHQDERIVKKFWKDVYLQCKDIETKAGLSFDAKKFPLFTNWMDEMKLFR